MARICPITNKKTSVGGGYSNRTRATKFNPTGRHAVKPNLQKKRIFIPELDKHVNVRVSSKALKTINKNGAYKTLKKAGLL